MSTDTDSVAPIERLLSNIPRLEPDGINWTAFSMRFRQAMQATRRWGDFDSSILRPTLKDPSAPTEAEIEALDPWEHEDLIACHLLPLSPGPDRTAHESIPDGASVLEPRRPRVHD